MNLNNYSNCFIFFVRNKLRLKKIMCLPKRLNTTQLMSC